MAENPDTSRTFLYASGYMKAMHKNCISCHTEQKTALNRPNLNECGSCHQRFYTEKKLKTNITEALPKTETKLMTVQAW